MFDVFIYSICLNEEFFAYILIYLLLLKILLLARRASLKLI